MQTWGPAYRFCERDCPRKKDPGQKREDLCRPVKTRKFDPKPVCKTKRACAFAARALECRVMARERACALVHARVYAHALKRACTRGACVARHSLRGLTGFHFSPTWPSAVGFPPFFFLKRCGSTAARGCTSIRDKVRKKSHRNHQLCADSRCSSYLQFEASRCLKRRPQLLCTHSCWQCFSCEKPGVLVSIPKILSFPIFLFLIGHFEGARRRALGGRTQRGTRQGEHGTRTQRLCAGSLGIRDPAAACGCNASLQRAQAAPRQVFVPGIDQSCKRPAQRARLGVYGPADNGCARALFASVILKLPAGAAPGRALTGFRAWHLLQAAVAFSSTPASARGAAGATAPRSDLAQTQGAVTWLSLLPVCAVFKRLHTCKVSVYGNASLCSCSC